MKRVLTAVVLLPLALAAIFLLSGWSFAIFALALVEIAAVEFSLLISRLTGRRVVWVVPVLVPVAMLLLLPDMIPCTVPVSGLLLGLGFLASGVVGIIALFSRLSLDETIHAIGLISFGVLYFAVPAAALVHLRSVGPWVVILVAVIIWAGDTAAFYIGTAFGRHKLAPVVSPNKSWEGAIASLLAGLLAAAAWGMMQMGHVDLALLAVAAVTSVTGQVGDLVESIFKRHLGVKDSSNLLPGHGGMLDRLDSLLFAFPTAALGLMIIGWL